MKALVDLTFSVTEGNMIHDALSEAGAERALVRRFPHTWLFPVEDESLYNAVWEGDVSMALDTEECRTIADALFARFCSQYDKGYETISDELSALAWKINRAAYPVRMANLAASCARSEGKKEAGDVPTRNPAPEVEPETLVLVRDASGVVRQVTLDEMEDMREAAQGIYEGQSPEPTEEPETLVPVRDAFGCRRMVTPDKLKTMSDAADVYHIVDWDGVIFETVETNLYTEALEWRDITAERLGVDSEKLDVMTAEEYESEWGDGEEEEPETVSNAEEELPAVRRGPLMDDKSDLYFCLLEGRNVI